MHSDASPAGSFASLLTPMQRRLAGRLEGFGDIVFGFAVSQCALQLPTVHGHVDLGRPLALVFYFSTFSLLASLWLTYHRILSGTYRPAMFDLILAFAYLALVSLMPFAMYSISHQTATLADARAAVAEYSVLFAALLGIAAIVALRNLRRGWIYVDAQERFATWMAIVRRCTLCVIMSIAVAVDLLFGPTWSTLAFLTIPVFLRLLKMFVKTAPPAERMGIQFTTTTAAEQPAVS